VSTPFVSARWLFFFHKVPKDSKIQTLNSLVLLISFTIGRVLYQWVIGLGSGIPWLYQEVFYKKSFSTTGDKFLLAEMTLAVFLNAFLNLYWLMLILKQA